MTRFSRIYVSSAANWPQQSGPVSKSNPDDLSLPTVDNSNAKAFANCDNTEEGSKVGVAG